MPKRTLREFAYAALVEEGWVEIASSSRRMQVMQHKEAATKMFLGQNGAIRQGRIKTESHPVSDARKAALVAKGRTILEAPK